MVIGSSKAVVHPLTPEFGKFAELFAYLYPDHWLDIHEIVKLKYIYQSATWTSMKYKIEVYLLNSLELDMIHKKMTLEWHSYKCDKNYQQFHKYSFVIFAIINSITSINGKWKLLPHLGRTCIIKFSARLCHSMKDSSKI